MANVADGAAQVLVHSPKRAKKQAEENGHGDLVAGVRPFLIERFYAKHEFTAEYMLGSSDAEAWSVRDVLQIAKEAGDSKAAQEWADLSLGYTESPGHPELRRAIAGLYGGPIGEDQVLNVVPEEGIFITNSTLLSPGDVVVAMSPCYQSLYEIARSKGACVQPWTARFTSGAGWAFHLGDLREILSKVEASGKKMRMLVTNFPHNPTSWMPTSAEHEELVRLCAAHNAIWFSDEMYWGSAVVAAKNSDGRQEEPLSSCRRYKRAITLGGLSKSYGMPGLRIGWLATQDAETMARLRQMKDYTTICGSAPSEALAIIGLRHGDRLIQRGWETSVRNRVLFQRFCDEFPHLFDFAPEPTNGLMGFVVLRGWAAQMGAQAFCDWCVEAASCVWVPSDCFELSGTPAVRVGFGRLNFAEAVARLSAHLRTVGADGPSRQARAPAAA